MNKNNTNVTINQQWESDKYYEADSTPKTKTLTNRSFGGEQLGGLGEVTRWTVSVISQVCFVHLEYAYKMKLHS